MNNLESDKYYTLVRKHAALLSDIEALKDFLVSSRHIMGLSSPVLERELNRILKFYEWSPK